MGGTWGREQTGKVKKRGQRSKKESLSVNPPVAKSSRLQGTDKTARWCLRVQVPPLPGVSHPLGPAAPKQPSAALLLRALATCAHCHGNQLSWHLESGSHQKGGRQMTSNRASFTPKPGLHWPLGWDPHAPRQSDEEAGVLPHSGPSHNPSHCLGKSASGSQAEMTQRHGKVFSVHILQKLSMTPSIVAIPSGPLSPQV